MVLSDRHRRGGSNQVSVPTDQPRWQPEAGPWRSRVLPRPTPVSVAVQMTSCSSLTPAPWTRTTAGSHSTGTAGSGPWPTQRYPANGSQPGEFFDSPGTRLVGTRVGTSEIDTSSVTSSCLRADKRLVSQPDRMPLHRVLRCGECVTGTWPRRLPHTSGTSKLGRLRGRANNCTNKAGGACSPLAPTAQPARIRSCSAGAAGLPAEVVPTG